MTSLRSYRFEFCWLALLVLVFLLTPRRASAQALSWWDFAGDCSSESGWCIPFRDHFPFELMR
jgi:hypothetical protein